MIGDPLLLCPKQIGFANLFCLHACCPFWPIDKTYPTGEYDNHARPHQGIGLRFPVSVSRSKTEHKRSNTQTRYPGRRHPRLLQAAFSSGFWQ